MATCDVTFQMAAALFAMFACGAIAASLVWFFIFVKKVNQCHMS